MYGNRKVEYRKPVNLLDPSIKKNIRFLCHWYQRVSKRGNPLRFKFNRSDLQYVTGECVKMHFDNETHLFKADDQHWKVAESSLKGAVDLSNRELNELYQINN